MTLKQIIAMGGGGLFHGAGSSCAGSVYFRAVGAVKAENLFFADGKRRFGELYRQVLSGLSKGAV